MIRTLVHSLSLVPVMKECAESGSFPNVQGLQTHSAQPSEEVRGIKVAVVHGVGKLKAKRKY